MLRAAKHLPRATAASAYARFRPLLEPQKTQILAGNVTLLS